MSEDNQDILKDSDKLYDTLKKAHAITNSIVSMECFHNDVEGHFEGVLALTELCNSLLDEARALHEKCESELNEFSLRWQFPKEGDHLPGDLLSALLMLASDCKSSKSWGIGAADLGSILARHALHNDEYRPAVELLAKMGHERGLNIEVRWDLADHWGVIYRERPNPGRENQCA